MRPLSDYEIERFKASAAESFSQSATVLTYSAVRNTFGELEDTYTEGGALSCGLEYVSSKRNGSGEVVATEYDAVLRVAQGAITDSRDRVRIDGVTFTIVAIEPRSTISLLKLKRVEI